jgi:hypothetical protein
MCQRRTKILLRDSKGSALSAEQDKLDAFPIPKLDSTATRETQPSQSLRQTAEFGEQALESLADGIRRGSVKVREFFSVGSV